MRKRLLLAVAAGLIGWACWAQWNSLERMGERRFQALIRPAKEVLVGVCWPFADNQDGMADGLALAEAELKAEGIPLRLVLRDTGHKGANARRIALDFANTPEMSAVLGYDDKSPVMKASVIYEASRLLCLMLGAPTSDSRGSGSRYVLHTIASRDKITRALARMLVGRGYRNIALIYEEIGYGNAGANGSGTPQGAGDGSASPLPPAKTKKNAHSEGLQKKKTEILKPIDRDRAAAKKCVAAVQKLMTARFAKQRKAMVKAVKDDAAKLMKMDPQDYADLWDDIAKADQDATRKKLEKALTPMATDGAKQGLSQVLAVVPVDPDRDVDAMLSQANEQAIAFAQGRAAELVGMRWDDDAGEWITNPNPEWAIDGTTRDNIQSLTTQAMEEGWSNDDLAQRIQDDEGFSDARAEMIARTETAFADVHGNMDAYEASGLVDATEWVVGAGECDICEENAAAGPVAMGEAFPSGDDMPPAHPNCRCDVLPVVNTAPEEE